MFREQEDYGRIFTHVAATKFLPLFILPGGQKMSLSAECSPHNTIQGLHLHFSRGDNVICINLMSISEGKKRTADTCGSKLCCSKALFSPLLLTILALACRQSTVTQIIRRSDIFVTEGLFSLAGKCAQEMEFRPLLNG